MYLQKEPKEAPIATAAQIHAWTQAVLSQTEPAGSNGLPTRILGRTGVRVSLLCLGGWHLGMMKDQDEAIRIMHAAIDDGMTFFDNAWEYHDGHSEDLMGRALAQDGKRDQVFLMTKNCARDYAGSKQHLEDSLRRLRTDHLDLWQFHELVYDNDPDWIFDRGAIRAAIEAREEGKVRFIGFTGHKDPRIHRSMLSKPHVWDTSQMPLNVMDAFYRSFQHEVVPECLERNVGIIGMKSLGGGWPQGKFLEPAAAAAAGLTVEECIRYTLSLPVSTLVVGINTMEHLRQDVAAARDFKPMTVEEMRRLEARVAHVAGDGRHELFKSSKMYDGPVHRAQHEFDLQTV